VADFDSTVAALRKWTRGHDPHVRAAVELLAWHEAWLRRRDFTSACVHRDEDGTAWIRWDEAREFAVSGRAVASTSEMSVLDLAVAIGSNQYKLSHMGDAHARAIVKAFADALGVEVAGRD
jgi:hypothetical protein